jgi:hypothetical protein
MIFPEMVCLFLMRTFYLFIFNCKMAEMRRPMDFWKGFVVFFSFGQNFKRLMLRLRELGRCANRDPCCLPYVWSICIRTYISFCFHLSMFTNYYTSPFRGNLPYHSHSKELPNIPGKVSVRNDYYGISVVIDMYR